MKFAPLYGQYSKSIYRRESPADDWTLLGWTAGDSYTDDSVSYGKRYQYAVRASGGSLGAPSDALNIARLNVGAVLVHECFQASFVRQLRTAANQTELIDALRTAFQGCAGQIRSRYVRPLTDVQVAAIFATLVAHLTASYGTSSETRLFELIHTERTLNCGNHIWLVGEIIEAVLPSYTEKIFFLGFDHGFIGNHAFVYIESGGGMFLDGTAGLVAFGSHDDLFDRHGLLQENIYTFYGYWEDPSQAPGLDTFFWNAVQALRYGLYFKSEMLYEYERPRGFNGAYGVASVPEVLKRSTVVR